MLGWLGNMLECTHLMQEERWGRITIRYGSDRPDGK
jgi:hypothetical protein